MGKSKLLYVCYVIFPGESTCKVIQDPLKLEEESIMQEVNHKDYTERAIDLISQGKELLTGKYDEKINIMTIGWGQIGHIWGKPIMTVLVRKSRYTHGLIDKADNFTVSLAFDGHDEVLDFCGTKSGRDYDKFKECSITTSPGEKVTSPVIKEFDLHFECKIVFK